MEKYDAWLNVIITTGGIFFAVFVVIIPVIVIGGRVCYRKTGKQIDCPDFWGFAALGAGAFLAVCTIALFMLTLIVRDGMFFLLGVISVVGIVCCLLWAEESGDDDLEIYFKVVVSGLGIFVALGFVLSLPGYAEKLKAGTRQTRSTPWSRLPMSPSPNRTGSISSVALRRMTHS